MVGFASIAEPWLVVVATGTQSFVRTKVYHRPSVLSKAVASRTSSLPTAGRAMLVMLSNG